MATVHGQDMQPFIYGNGKRWAVLVGVNEYMDKHNYGNLHVCTQDATRVSEALIKGGFETDRVYLLSDEKPKKPLKVEIIAQLQIVAEYTEPDDLLLFYFSGHGAKEKEESYLVPCDGKSTILHDSALSLKRIREIMEQAQARAKVIIIDACHSGTNIGTKGPSPMPEGFIERVFGEAAGLAILASCKQGQLSHEWVEKNCSVYTYYLIEALHGKADFLRKRFVTVDDVSKYTVDRVKLWAIQHQVLQRPDLTYLVDGDIRLVDCQQLDKSTSKEEKQETGTSGVSSGQNYLAMLQEVAQKALAAFVDQDVWGSDCQPILYELSQITFPSFWQVLLSSSFVESPLYNIIIQLNYIDDQKKKLLQLIIAYMQDQQGGVKHKETRIREIKNNFISLIREIEHVQEDITHLEEEKKHLILGDDISSQNQEKLEEYIGSSLDVLREARGRQSLTNQFADIGAQVKKNMQIPREDVFARFKRIPLHALFIYTSEDQEIGDYVLKHWAALDDLGKYGSLAEDFCDFHPMLSQFNNAENGYAHLRELDVVRESGFQTTSDLPAIFFHDNHGASEYISFAAAESEKDIKKIIRAIFDSIKQQPTIAAVTRVKQQLGQENRLAGNNFTPSVDVKGTSSIGNNQSDEYNKLIEELRVLPSGDGRIYERLVKQILDLCLANDFASLSIKEQVRTYRGKRIRDFVIDNKNSKVGFWRDLKVVRGVEKILFDAKNYEDEVSYTEITSTLRYLRNKAFGNFMIIVSRRGINDWEEVIEDYGDEDKIILFLDDNDLIAMIEQKIKGESASSIIEEKYYSFLDMK